jgi:hypothetical protein
MILTLSLKREMTSFGKDCMNQKLGTLSVSGEIEGKSFSIETGKLGMLLAEILL